MIRVGIHGRPEVPPFQWQPPQTAETVTGIVADELEVQGGYLRDGQRLLVGKTVVPAGEYVFTAMAAQAEGRPYTYSHLQPGWSPTAPSWSSCICTYSVSCSVCSKFCRNVPLCTIAAAVE